MKALVVIPTYNEAESVVEVVDRVLAVDPRADVLVVDDGSPDGTAKLVLDRAEDDRLVAAEHGHAQRPAFGAGDALGDVRRLDGLSRDRDDAVPRAKAHLRSGSVGDDRVDGAGELSARGHEEEREEDDREEDVRGRPGRDRRREPRRRT